MAFLELICKLISKINQINFNLIRFALIFQSEKDICKRLKINLIFFNGFAASEPQKILEDCVSSKWKAIIA